MKLILKSALGGTFLGIAIIILFPKWTPPFWDFTESTVLFLLGMRLLIHD